MDQAQDRHHRRAQVNAKCHRPLEYLATGYCRQKCHRLGQEPSSVIADSHTGEVLQVVVAGNCSVVLKT